jgi:hypothetical protein
MSSRRQHSPEVPLCRFAFADGRHCATPAHPDYDGLCYSHGTLAPRTSRKDNLLRELAPLASGSFPGAVKTFTPSVVSFGRFVPSIWDSFRYQSE